ncbi:MAG TPA: CcmD family protein [Bryobacteraceae bacterium]|nr:CcmD family protein [Bryobacteraceae bacterium]
MDTRNLQYMFLGFLVAWLIVLVYVLLLAMREGRLKRELERVRRMVEKH